MNVVVPLYRTALNPDEWLSLERCFAVLGGYPITFVIPEGLDMTPVMMRFPSCRIESFDPSFFAGRYGYNHLMLSAEFYRRFLNWEYILIYQTDAFVFRDELRSGVPGDMIISVPPGLPARFMPIRFIKYVPG